MFPDEKLVLLRTFKERSKLTVFCSGFAAFMVFMLGEMNQWKPVGLEEWVIHMIGVEVFFTFGLFSLLGVVWGIFAPRWLEHLLQHGFRKLLTLFCVIGAASVFSIGFYLLAQWS